MGEKVEEMKFRVRENFTDRST